MRPDENNSGLLFNDALLDEAISAQWQRLSKYIDELPDHVVLVAAREDLLAAVQDQFWLDVPEIKHDQIAMLEPVETKLDARSLGRHVSDPSRPVLLNATVYTVVVPYEGDEVLFAFRPSQFTANPPRGKGYQSEIHLVYTMTDPDSVQLRQAYRQEIDMIDQWLGWVDGQVSQFNSDLDATAERLITARQTRLQANAEVAAGLGIPIRRRNHAPKTYTVPKKRKRVRTRSGFRGEVADPLDPVLHDETYEDILQIMDGMVTVMEQSPHAFVSMGEEDLRTHFLVQLNGQFEGDATGETFNYEGKSDILVKHLGKNVFVGECLIWDGPKSLIEKVGQILGYSSWRDTKTAIIVFNRRKDFSKVLERITPTVMDHPNTIEEVPVSGQTKFRFLLRHRDDPNRRLTLTVAAYDLPME